MFNGYLLVALICISLITVVIFIHVLIWYLCDIFGEASVKVFGTFLSQIVLDIFKSSLHIWDIRLLVDVVFANIFS